MLPSPPGPRDLTPIPGAALTAPTSRPTLKRPTPEADWRIISSIRALAMDAVEQAQSGHPGTPMALAPAAYVLWSRHLRFDPRSPDWWNRDRFVLSCGHASMLIYALLHLSGYDLSLEEIKAFRQWGSRTPGHPERGHTPGVEVTTGPLGQGVGNAVGMAMAARFLAGRLNRPGYPVVDHRIWAFVSDGDLMEGVASEAASLAGHLRLDSLKLIFDDNHITIDGDTALSFSEDVALRFQAYGWEVQRVPDGNDLAAIDQALTAAAASTRPYLILLRTHIGDPAPTKRDTAAAHGSPLGAEEVRRTKEIMGWPATPPFQIAAEANDWREACVARGASLRGEWQRVYDSYSKEFPALAAEQARWQAGELAPGWDARLPTFTPADGQLATRQASAKALNALADTVPNLIGGSADLAESTGSDIKNGGSFGPSSSGRNVHWGVREHAMGACLNGMAAHGGVRPYGSTFLIFTDYCKPSIRLAALSHLAVTYICTHDSIGLGEDGPTHQPIEQLAVLRATPNVLVIRPADANETVEAWRVAMEHRDGPVVLALTRQKLPVLDRSRLGAASSLRRGGYILREASAGPKVILIGTGSEVHLALSAADRLEAEGMATRVVSLPSWELFEAQPADYRDSVLPPAIRARVTIEAAGPMGWLRYATEDGEIIALDRFGASAPGGVVMEKMGLTVDRVVEAAKRVAAARGRR